MPHHDTRRKVTVAADDLRRVTDHLEPMLDPQHRGAPATLGDVAWVAGPLADALGAVLGAVQDLVRAAVSVPEPECASPAVGLTVTGTIYALDGQIPRLSDRGTVSGPADAVAKLLAQFGAQQVEVRPIPDVRIDDRPERHGFTLSRRHLSDLASDAALPADEGLTLHVQSDPKMLRETLCLAQAALNVWPSDEGRRPSHIARLQRLIDECDRHRPLGPDGKHGHRHTLICGCDQITTGEDDEPVESPRRA